MDVALSQFGTRIRGTGHIQGEPGQPFEFQGRVKWNVFYGTFSRRDTHVLAGTGTFVLKIAADTKSMTGCCAWFDSLIDEAWMSEYQWTRKG